MTTINGTFDKTHEVLIEDLYPGDFFVTKTLPKNKEELFQLIYINESDNPGLFPVICRKYPDFSKIGFIKGIKVYLVDVELNVKKYTED